MICKVQLLDTVTGDMVFGVLSNEDPGSSGAAWILVDGERVDTSRYQVVGAVSNTRACNEQVESHLREQA